jgi:Trk K+ transport system NAD-binding subunit
MAAEAGAGHYVVCGLGVVGYRIVELLHRLGETVVVITEGAREEWKENTKAAGIELILGDAREASMMHQARLGSARALIAATDKDLVNIEIALDAKRERPELPVVVRLFDQNLARHLESSFDVRRALGMSTLAAPAFAAAALGEDVVASFSAGGEPFVVGRVRGRAADELALETGSTVAAVLEQPRARDGREGIWTVLLRRPEWNRRTESGARRAQTIARRRRGGVLGRLRTVWSDASPVARGLLVGLLSLMAVSVAVFGWGMRLSAVDAFYFVVTTITTTGYGDISPRAEASWLKLYACLLMFLGSASIATVYSLITDFLVTARFKELMGRREVPEGGHVIVAGIGNVGYRVIEELAAAEIPVVAIERNPEGSFLRAIGEQAAIVTGDARLPETLARAGVGSATAVISVSSDDAANLSIGLIAKQLNPALRSVVRLFDADFARKVEMALTVDAALGASRIAAPTFVAAAVDADVVQAFVLGERFYELMDRKVPAAWDGVVPSQLAGEGMQVLWRDPGGPASRPGHAGEQPLAAGERVLLARGRNLLREGLRVAATTRYRV